MGAARIFIILVFISFSVYSQDFVFNHSTFKKLSHYLVENQNNTNKTNDLFTRVLRSDALLASILANTHTDLFLDFYALISESENINGHVLAALEMSPILARKLFFRSSFRKNIISSLVLEKKFVELFNEYFKLSGSEHLLIEFIDSFENGEIQLSNNAKYKILKNANGLNRLPPIRLYQNTRFYKSFKSSYQYFKYLGLFKPRNCERFFQNLG